jgi:hypothetical protein
MDISKFLETHKLTGRWLIAQLRMVGYEISDSFLSRILSGERNSDYAQEVRAAATAICYRYGKSMDMDERSAANAEAVQNGR